MQISIVIFCYNELESLGFVVNSCMSFLEDRHDFEVLIVDDGSTDGSAIEADKLAMKDKATIRVLHHLKNKGIGEALKTGYYNARYEYVCAIPADGQFDVSQLRLVGDFDDNTYYSFYRPSTDYNMYRRVLTWFNRIFNQHILGIYMRDVNWVKVYRKSQLEYVSPQLSSSLVESEICAKLYKRNVLPIEIPSPYLSRKSGEAKGGSWKTLSRAILDMGKLIWVVWRF